MLRPIDFGRLLAEWWTCILNRQPEAREVSSVFEGQLRCVRNLPLYQLLCFGFSRLNTSLFSTEHATVHRREKIQTRPRECRDVHRCNLWCRRVSLRLEVVLQGSGPAHMCDFQSSRQSDDVTVTSRPRKRLFISLSRSSISAGRTIFMMNASLWKWTRRSFLKSRWQRAMILGFARMKTIALTCPWLPTNVVGHFDARVRPCSVDVSWGPFVPHNLSSLWNHHYKCPWNSASWAREL